MHKSPQKQARTLGHPTSSSYIDSSKKPGTEMQPGDVIANGNEWEKEELHPFNP